MVVTNCDKFNYSSEYELAIHVYTIFNLSGIFTYKYHAPQTVSWFQLVYCLYQSKLRLDCL